MPWHYRLWFNFTKLIIRNPSKSLLSLSWNQSRLSLGRWLDATLLRHNKTQALREWNFSLHFIYYRSFLGRQPTGIGGNWVKLVLNTWDIFNWIDFFELLADNKLQIELFRISKITVWFLSFVGRLWRKAALEEILILLFDVLAKNFRLIDLVDVFLMENLQENQSPGNSLENFQAAWTWLKKRLKLQNHLLKQKFCLQSLGLKMAEL